MRVLSCIALSLMAALACACATSGGAGAGDRALLPGSRVDVEYHEDGALVLGLRNASSQSMEEAYGQEGSVQRKIASDESIAKLLERWTELGFFEAAAPSAWPQAKATLTISIDGRPQVRSRLPLQMSSLEDLQQFNECLAFMRAIYDNTPSFHSSTVGAKDLVRQNERIQQNAQEALERTRGRQ